MAASEFESKSLTPGKKRFDVRRDRSTVRQTFAQSALVMHSHRRVVMPGEN